MINEINLKRIDFFRFRKNHRKEKWKQKFFDIINFIRNKIFNKQDRKKYMDVTTDLYENDLIEYKTYDSIREDYDYSVKKDKNKDDFDIGL